MPAIDFPNNPSVGSQVTNDGRIWQYDGDAWNLIGGSLDIGNSAVTSAKLATNSVIESKIAADAVTAGKIAASAVTETKIANNAVTTNKVNDLAITEGKLADSAVTAIKIANSTITGGKIASTTIVEGNLANSAVTENKLGAGSVTNTKLGDGAVTADKVANNAVALGTKTTGDYVASLVAGTGVNLLNNSGESASPTISIGQAVATTSDVQFASLRITTVEEPVLVSATAMSATTINIDARTAPTVYYTTAATANGTLNIRSTASESLNTLLAVNEMITATFMVTNGATPYRPTTFQVDGASITPRWQGGTAPSAGNANSVDAYTLTVLKTANATFQVFASQTRFA